MLRYAQQLHSLAPDESIESQIKYIQECPVYLDINEIATMYLKKVETGMKNDEEFPF